MTTAQQQIPRTVRVRTQQELGDALRDARFGELDHIVIDSPEATMLRITETSPADVSIAGVSKVHVTGHVHATARDCAAVFASQFAEVDARDDARVIAVDFSSVDATDRAHVEAHDDSRVNLAGTADGYVRDRSRATARDHARLEAHGTATIAGHGHAHISAYDVTRVTAVPVGGSLVVYGRCVRQLDNRGRLVTIPGRAEPAPEPDAMPL